MHYLVADIARTITLCPNDVLLSGTPAHSRTVFPGDVVEVEVEGLGTLRNHIVGGPTPIRDDVGAQPTESEEVRSTALGGDCADVDLAGRSARDGVVGVQQQPHRWHLEGAQQLSRGLP